MWTLSWEIQKWRKNTKSIWKNTNFNELRIWAQNHLVISEEIHSLNKLKSMLGLLWCTSLSKLTVQYHWKTISLNSWISLGITLRNTLVQQERSFRTWENFESKSKKHWFLSITLKKSNTTFPQYKKRR